MKRGTKVLLGLAFAVAAGVFLASLFVSSEKAHEQEATAPDTTPPVFLLPPDTQLRPRPTALPEPAPSERLSAFAAIDEILASLPAANVAFNTPERMNLYETATIHLALGLAVPVDTLKRRIKAEGEKSGAQIRVSNRMQARLTGANFSITAITPETQAVSQREVTDWKWEVVPTSTGRHYLHLTLSVILDVEGEPTARTIDTFDELIDVDVTLGQRVTVFVSNHWEWLWAAVLIPLAGWIWTRVKRRSKPAE